MRRIFDLYLDGLGYAAIAQALNAEAILPPRERRRASVGWVDTCIRELLRNPKYAGEFSFSTRKWQRHPITRKRVARRSEETDVLRSNRPELAIVDRSIWDAVQAQLVEHAKLYKERAMPHGKTEYLLTGLLRCGVQRVDANQRRQLAPLLPLRGEPKAWSVCERAERSRDAGA